jgi:hypothetical protein
MARLRLLLALCLIGVGTTFGALALSGYYSPGASQKKPNVASIDSKSGSRLLRAKPRQRLVAADTQPTTTQSTATHTMVQTTTQATVEVLPWAKPKPPVVVKSPPREAAGKPKDKPKDAPPEKRPQQAAAFPWNLFSN